MCGVVGVMVAEGRQLTTDLVRTMADRLRHRGPNYGAEWIDSRATVALGHRRLSIIDLSPAGHQPMPSPRGRYVLTYNGEVYNFPTLRRALEQADYVFRGNSDTEVIGAAFEQWGVEEAVSRFIGMFAIGAWDEETRTLFLVRDRLGIKPLYYGVGNGAFQFASELRALLASPFCPGEIDQAGLALYLRYGYVPTPFSILRGVRKVPPGHIVQVRPGQDPVLRPFWRLSDVVAHALTNPFEGDEKEATDELERLLREAVKMRLVSDVPIGAFLSGGIDSSTVVSLMQTESPEPVHTFSIGFHEQAYNEARYAAAVAGHLGTCHTELYVSADEAMEIIPGLPDLYDEPFADVSQIPTYLVSRLAKKAVTVSLSGDGGDELFGGYNRYLFVSRFWSRVRKLPIGIRSFAASALTRPTMRQWDCALAAVSTYLPTGWCPSLPGEKAHKLAAIMGAQDLLTLHRILISQSFFPEELLASQCRSEDRLEWAGVEPPLEDGPLRLLYLDTITYLPDDLLTKLDRASMAVSLEARVPMLDHRVVEFAWRLPLHLRIRNGETKWILRRVLNRYVPRDLIDRPKMGFGVPIHTWLRGPLRPWAEELLRPDKLRSDGYFQAEPVRRMWEAHLAERVERGGALWTILMFQAWRERSRQWN